MANKKALTGALNAVKLGLKVLPLTPYTRTGKDGDPIWEKLPRIERWPELATDDPELIQKWASGDFTGTSSKSSRPCEHWGGSLDGFIAFDTDTPAAQEELQNIFVSAGLPGIVPTYATKTGRGGRHYIYKQPEGYSLGNSVGALAPKLDTRGGAGGFIVLPGTTNPANNGEYTVLNDAEIAVLPKEVAELIRGRVSVAKSKSSGGVSERRAGSIPDTELKVQRATEWLLSKEGGVEGCGGEADAVYVGRVLADIGLSEERAQILARAIYNPRCEPEWEEDELDTKIHNGFAYRENEIGCADPDLAISGFGEEGEATEEDFDRFPIRDSGDFNLTPPPPRETLVEDFIAHGKYLTLLYGRGGSGKSLLGWQMLRELIRGKSFLGKVAGSICSHLRPLVLSLEEPKEDVHFRYWKQTQRIDPEKKGKEPLWCDMRGTNPHLFKVGRSILETDEGLNALIRVVKAREINLLLIDSLSRIFPGNENDRAAVTAFGRAIDRFVEETGCHVILLAHTNKAGDFSGSSGWEAICRQMFLVTSEALDGKTIYTLTATKTNEGPRGAFVRYRFDDWYYVPVPDEEYETLKSAAGRSKTSDEVGAAVETVRDILQEEGEMQYTPLRKEMKSRGFDKGVFDFAIDSMKKMSELKWERRPNDHGDKTLWVWLE